MRYFWIVSSLYADYIKLVAKEKELTAKYNEYLANTKEESISKTSEEQNTTNRFAVTRKKLASKIGEKLGTNLQHIKLPKKIKNIEAKISKLFDKSGR